VILARAKAYAANRNVCGVHFASDTVASEALATGLAVELMQNAKFQEEFAAAKLNWSPPV
jgi:acid phosphatase (class A)